MTPGRVSVLRLALEFPGVPSTVIRAVCADVREGLRPHLADSLTEMTELVARQRIRKSVAVHSRSGSHSAECDIAQ